MKSRRWILSLLGFSAYAQSPTISSGGSGSVKSSTLSTHECIEFGYLHTCESPKNNYCPVCGTKADPFRPSVAEYSLIQPCASISPDSHGEVNAVCRQWTKEDLPKERMVRCKKCNVAFFQDAEIW